MINVLHSSQIIKIKVIPKKILSLIVTKIKYQYSDKLLKFRKKLSDYDFHKI